MWAWLLTLWVWLATALSVPLRGWHLSLMGATSCLSYFHAVLPEWEARHPGVTVAVAGGGSIAGLVEVSRGRVDIGVSDIVAQRQWIGTADLTAVRMGALPIVFVVNPDAGVTNIGRAALRQVLAGHIRWWSQLGGAHRPIIVVARPLGSGARYVVDHAIMGGQRLTSGAIVQLSNGAVMATVAETPGALGFVERRPDTASVALLAVDGRRFDPKDPRAWPFWAYPRLYYRSDAPVLVRELADDLAHNPRRQAFDIYDAVAAR